MKTYNKTFLPDVIEYKGENFKMLADISAKINQGANLETLVNCLKSQGKKSILVNVLSKNLKGKTDLHGQLYKPSKWIFTN